MSKKKGKKMQQAKYELGQEVQFQGDTYKVVEVLAEGSSLHIKKVDAPFNTMVIPTGKLNTEDTLNDIEKAFKNSEENEDLPDFVEPDDWIGTEAYVDPETQSVLDEIKKEAGTSAPSVQDIFSDEQVKATQGSLMGY